MQQENDHINITLTAVSEVVNCEQNYKQMLDMTDVRCDKYVARHWIALTIRSSSKP